MASMIEAGTLLRAAANWKIACSLRSLVIRFAAGTARGSRMIANVWDCVIKFTRRAI
jgi:hypothetical protein